MLSREVVSLTSAACMLDPSENGSARLLGMVDTPEPPEAVEKAADLTSTALPTQMRAVQVSSVQFRVADLRYHVADSLARDSRLHSQARCVCFVWCRSCACT